MVRIDPRLALVWRSPTVVQIGVPRAEVVAELTPDEEHLLAAIRSGTPRSTLTRYAVMRGISEATLDNFLRVMEPALEPDPPPARVRIGIDGHGPLADWVAHLLGADYDVKPVNAASVAEADNTKSGQPSAWRPDIVVLTGTYAITPVRAGVWLRREIPHLSVVIGDTTAEVSHVVVGEYTPCLICGMLEQADLDGSWAGILAQLHGKPSAGETVRACLEVAARVVRTIETYLRFAPDELSRLIPQRARLDSRLGAWTTEEVHPSPRCACQALPENATPRVALRAVLPDERKTHSTFARRA